MDYDHQNYAVSMEQSESERKVGKVGNKAEEMAPQHQQPLNTGGGMNYNLKQASHPVACVFTFLFKVLAFLMYFFIGSIISEVTTFITVVILSGLDFWVVKNVTGRLLVGLRWWSDFDENGKEIWKYESHDHAYQSNMVDAGFFWTSQFASTLTWAVFLVMKVLSFSIFWSLLVFINFSLSATNLYGYYKCRSQHSKKLDDLKKQLGQQGLMHFTNKLF